MGLVRGFVLSLNRRGLLAVLAIAVSVGYALVAGATVTGLEEAQATLSQDLHDPGYIVTKEERRIFHVDDLPRVPAQAIAVADVEGRTFYTLRGGPGVPPENGSAIAGPATRLPDDTAELQVQDVNLTVESGEPYPGARTDWIAVGPETFASIGGPASGIHVAHFEDLSEDQRSRLEQDGFRVYQAPAASSFYVSGADELVTSVGVTVASSAIVVALLASGFVNMELRAKRQTLATLKLYAGTPRVRRVIAGRGLVLLVGGHLLALAATFALTTLLTSAARLDVTLEPGFAAAATGATFLGGTIGLAGPLREAGERVEASELAEREPPAWLPVWLRPSLASWRILVPLIAAGLILAASLGVVFGMVDLPTQLFGQGGGEVIASTSGNPLRGSVEAFPGFHLGEVDGYTGASPEIFAPSTIDGQALMVRGVSWPQVSRLEGMSLAQGRAPQGQGEALVGTRLADRLGLSVGEELTLPSAYTASVTDVRVVGMTQGGGLLDDEVLVPLQTARGMTNLEPGRVNMVRYGTTDNFEPESLPRGVEAKNLSLSPSDPVPFEEVTVRVDLVNFAETTQTRHLTLRVNGQPAEDAWPTVGGRSTGIATMSFTVPAKGVESVQVNPETRPDQGEPAYEIQAPTVATVDAKLRVEVRTPDGEPAENVHVSVGERTNTTDERGRTHLQGLEPGNVTLSLSGPEGRAAQSLLLIERANLYRPHLVLKDIDGPSRVKVGQPWEGVVEFVNLGGEAFGGRPELRVDNETRDLHRVRLLSGQETRLPVRFSLDEGNHALGTNETKISVNVTAASSSPSLGEDEGDDTGSDRDGGGGDSGEARTVDELLQQRRERAQASSQVGQSATQAFVGDTFENLNAALTLIVVSTVIHAGLVTIVAVFRQVDERRANLGTYSALGAGEGDVRGRAIREYAIVGVPAAVLGVAGGLLVAILLASAGLLTGFGHTLSPRFDLGFALRVTMAAVGTTLVAAILAIHSRGNRKSSSLMEEGPTRSQRPPLETLTGEPTE